MEIMRVYDVIGNTYRKDDYWALDLKVASGEVTSDNTKTVTFDNKEMADKFRYFIQKRLPEVISARMQELAEELYSLQTMVDSGELYWQLAEDNEEDEDEDEDFPESPEYLN